jgi:hypothetical protein
MNRITLLLLLSLSTTTTLYAQTEPAENYRNFPLVVSIQFHALSLPFKDLKTNFKNVGLGLGTEFSLNGQHNWVQQVQAVWYRNKAVGDGLLFYTQNAWRPTVAGGFFAEVKAGAGYLYAFRPVASFRPENNRWTPVGRKGKGLFAVPVGISLGYHRYEAQTYLSPFVSYQFLLVSGYNPSVPLVPETLIQAGTSLHFTAGN